MSNHKQASLTLEGICHPGKKVAYYNDLTKLEWLPNGQLLKVEQVDETTRYVEVDPVTWQASDLTDTKKLAALFNISEADVTLPLAWHPTKPQFVIHQKGALHLVDLTTHSTVSLAHPSGDVTEVMFSPDGSHLAFVVASDLYVVDVASRAEKRLTQGGAEHLRRSLIIWSPDARYLYFSERDMSKVVPTPVVDYFSNPATVAWNYDVHYTGTPHFVQSKLGRVDLEGKTQWCDNPHPGQETSLGEVVCSPEGRLVVEWYARGNRWLELHGYDNTKPTLLVREAEGPWQNDRSAPIFLSDGSFLYESDRTGYRHVYHFARDGSVLRQVTAGAWMVQRLHGYDATIKRVLFDARGEHSHLTIDSYSVHLDGTALTRLTKERGSHSVRWNQDFTFFLDRWSNKEQPPMQALFDTTATKLRQVDETPASQIKALGLGEVRFQQIPAKDGTPLETMLIFPPDFDPRKKYPVFQHVYGFSSNDVYGCPVVGDVWGAEWDGATTEYLLYHLLAQQGYVIWSCDSRASSGKSATTSWTFFKSIGSKELQDQLDGLTWLEQQGWADMSRVGIHGWSTGGYMVSYFMGHTDKYKIGIPAGVFDFLLADNDEETMGLPEEENAPFERESSLGVLPNIQGKLLVIHGTSDVNTPVHNAMMYADILERAEKDYELFLVPGMAHGPQTPMQAWTVYRKMYQFIHQNL